MPRNPNWFNKVVARRMGQTLDPALEIQGQGGLALWTNGQHRGGNNLSDRYELIWRAGERGHPCINADMASGTEATREPADPNFEVLGTNGTSATAGLYAEGGVLLLTTTGSADQVIILPHLDTAQSGWATTTWGTDQEVHWSCLIKTYTAVTSQTFWAGLKLTNTPTVVTDDDQVFFRYAAATASGALQVISSIGGTDTTTTTNITVAAATKYYLRIEIDSLRVARFYVNGLLYYTTTALTDATDLIPYIGVQTDTTAAKGLVVLGQSISRIAG